MGCLVNFRPIYVLTIEKQQFFIEILKKLINIIKHDNKDLFG